MSKLKASFKYISITVALTITASIVGQAFLRSFHRLLSFDEMFSGIFAQITDASMTSPIILLLAISLLSTYVIVKLRKHKLLAILAAIFLAIALLAVAILFTKVNGVMFVDVLRTLIPLLESGAI